jgi:hypothetical protein
VRREDDVGPHSRRNPAGCKCNGGRVRQTVYTAPGYNSRMQSATAGVCDTLMSLFKPTWGGTQPQKYINTMINVTALHCRPHNIFLFFFLFLLSYGPCPYPQTVLIKVDSQIDLSGNDTTFYGNLKPDKRTAEWHEITPKCF